MGRAECEVDSMGIGKGLCVIEGHSMVNEGCAGNALPNLCIINYELPGECEECEECVRSVRDAPPG